MRFSDLSSDAKQHALAALGILISGASQVDIVSSKALGKAWLLHLLQWSALTAPQMKVMIYMMMDAQVIK